MGQQMGSIFKKLKHDLTGRHVTKHELEETGILRFSHSISDTSIRKSTELEVRQTWV